MDVFAKHKALGGEVQRLLQAVESAMAGTRDFHHCPEPDGFLVLLREWTDYRAPAEPAGSAATSPGD